MPLASFPNIDYKFWLNNYSWENFSSMNKMIKTMINKKYISSAITPKNISENIQIKIESYIENNNDEILFEIFKLIQTWGGKSTGSNTLKISEEWENVIENDLYKTYKDKYREFIRLVLDGKSIDSFYLMTNKKKVIDKIQDKNIGINIKGLSFSFVPKHICFWSGLGDRTQGLPILDDVIAKIVYKVNKAEAVDFKTFIEDINKLILNLNENLDEEKKFIPSHIEMALFAFSGNYWETMKTASKEVKDNPKIKNSDISEVKKIIDGFSYQIKNTYIEENLIKEESKSNSILTLRKNEYLMYNDGFLYIKKLIFDKLNSKSIKIDAKISLKYKGETYLKFIGNINSINLIR
jgi:hypothetical protein